MLSQNGSRWKNGNMDEATDEEEEAGKTKAPVKKAKAKKASKKGTNPKKAKSKKKGHQTGENYKPGDYAAERKRYIAEMIEWYDVKYREASSWWNESSERAELLKGMSEQELRRRRFI